MWYLIIFNVIFICICLFYYYINRQKIEKNYIKKKAKKLEKEIEAAISSKKQYQDSLESVIQERQRTAQLLETQIKETKEQCNSLLEELEDYENKQRQKIDSQIREYEKQKIKNMNLNFSQVSEERQKAAEEQHNIFLSKLEKEKKEKQNELDCLDEQIKIFQAKQEAINQEILRRRELEEKSEFYRVCLSDEAISDINLLQATKQSLKKPEIIDKIIYDSYVAKPVLEMVKRVLQNSTCCGIYKITCQETKEIYIGKSTDIKSRWQQHCKSAFNCGTIASSVLHRKMQQYGIENFTFELLETAPKDQLTEREKFYINFYQTKETGLNERNG